MDQTLQLVSSILDLSKRYQTSEPNQASALKKAFKKSASMNDLSRAVVYLMEVVGVSDMRVKTLQKDNDDLRELLKLHDIKIDGEDPSVEETPKVPEQVADTSV